jgi:hypothetical protein
MRQCDGFFNVVLNRSRRPSVLAAAIAGASLLLTGGAWAQHRTLGPVNLQFTIPVPIASTNKTAGLYAYDISGLDQQTQTYFLSDRSNSAVDMIDAASGTFIKQITATPPFAGVVLNSTMTAGDNSLSGPNGNATGVVDGQNCLFAGDTETAPKTGGRVVSFQLPGGTQVSDFATGGTMRADEMSFDPKDSVLFVVNNAEVVPFVTLINVSNTCALTLRKKITYPFATNGAEASVWDPATKLFYESIPQVGDKANPGAGQNGLVISIDPLKNKIIDMFPVTLCQPAGIALNPTNGDLLLGCSVVFDTAGGVWSGTDALTAAPYQVVFDPVSGLVQAYVPGVGSSDEVFYDAFDNHWYTGSSSSPYAPSVAVSTTPPTPLTAQGAAILGVIDGSSFALDQLVPTFNVPVEIVSGKLVHVSGAGHSVAANGTNGWVFVPAPVNNALPGCLTGCIQVFSR